jgi:hypothetical protein
MYGTAPPFTLGLLQSVVGNTAMPPDDWTGLVKACDYRWWETGFVELCQGRQTIIWPMVCISLQICSWEEDLLKT